LLITTASQTLSLQREDSNLKQPITYFIFRIIQDESDKIMDETDGICNEIYSSSNFNNIVDIGTAVVTIAGTLPAKYIIHVVSPIWSGGENGEDEKLGQTVINA